MRTAAAIALASALVCLAGPAKSADLADMDPSRAGYATAQKASDIFMGDTNLLPRDWNDAPKELLLPLGWGRGIKELVMDTKATNHERGACLSYGRTESRQVEISNRLVELGKLELEADALERKGDPKAVAASQKAAAFRAALEADASYGNGFDFEFQRASKGMSLTVHIPECVGSQVGNMHTHPDAKQVFFSHADIQYTAFKALYNAQSIGLVASYTDTMMLVVTRKFLDDWKSEAALSRKSRAGIFDELEKIKLTCRAIVAGASTRGDLGRLYATYLRDKGLALYEGVPPLLKKVEPYTQYRSDFIEVSWGDVKPVRSSRTEALVVLKNLVHSDYKVAPTDYRKDIVSRLTRARKSGDEKFLSDMGREVSDKIIQELADNDVDEYDLGACMGKSPVSIDYAPKCFGKSDFSLKRQRCNQISPEKPAISWYVEGEGAPRIEFYYRSEESKDWCETVTYPIGPDGLPVDKPVKSHFIDTLRR